MKRIGIYLIYDKDGIVDNYIPYLLEKIMPHLSRLVVVCNGFVAEEGVGKLKKYTDDIFFRENTGYDAGGFKDALIQYVGWEQMDGYDELLLFNDSFFGPFGSFDNVFGEMERRELDFWSMTKNSGSAKAEPAVQSYFIVIRKRLLSSVDFREYWEGLPYFTDFEEVIQQYEMRFAAYFEKKGYKWDSYIKTEKYDYLGKRDYRMSLYHTVQYEIMLEQSYPILKRKLFGLDACSKDYGLEKHSRENFLLALKYIKEHTAYDMNLIWENVLRVYSLRNIQDCCCLRYILPDICGDKSSKPRKALVMLWISAAEICDENISRLRNAPSGCQFIIYTNSESVVKKIQSVESDSVRAVWVGKVRDYLSSLRREYKKIRDYDYVAFFHDCGNKPTYDTPYTVEASRIWGDWENLFGSGEYIDNILETFEKNQNLGMLVTPRPLHGKFFFMTDNKKNPVHMEWLGPLAEELGVQGFIDREERVADWSSCFWCRTDCIEEQGVGSLLAFLEQNMGDCQCQDRLESVALIFPYYCQKQGYYTGIVEAEGYAQMYETMMSVYHRQMFEIYNPLCYFQTHDKLKKIFTFFEKNSENIRDFVEKHEKIYIYGAGIIALYVSSISYVQNFVCYVVSDGQKKPEQYNGHPIMYISEIDFEENDGMIVALKQNSFKEAEPMLAKRIDRQNILCLDSKELTEL